jgi:AraC-like DNA-binding protein
MFDFGLEECKYLYHQYRVSEKRLSAKTHTHPFWQIEIVNSGSGNCTIEGKEYSFHAGDIIIIPKEAKHSFFYPERDCKWLSVKLNLSVTEKEYGTGVFSKDPLLESAKDIILQILPQESLPGNRMTILLNTTLRLIMEYYLINCSELAPIHSDFLKKVFAAVASRSGKYITVSEVGELIGFSGKYAANRFRKEAGCTLKHYIDEDRFNHARKMLSFTNDSITEIAESLEFSDVYAFSRFFKHWSAQSPTQFKENQLRGL